MRKWISSAATAILVFGFGPACKDDNTGPGAETEFEATLTGTAERPDPVSTTATGTATVEIDEDNQTIEFTINVTNLVSPTLAHIHIGSTAEAGPIAVNLLPTAPAAGTFTGELASGTRVAADVTGGETFTTLVAKIRAGSAYINVHTVAHPTGELRGQLVADD